MLVKFLSHQQCVCDTNLSVTKKAPSDTPGLLPPIETHARSIAIVTMLTGVMLLESQSDGCR